MATASLHKSLREFLVQTAADGEYDTLYLTRLPATPPKSAAPAAAPRRAAAAAQHGRTRTDTDAAPPSPFPKGGALAPRQTGDFAAAAADHRPPTTDHRGTAAPALLCDAPADSASDAYGFVRPPGGKQAQLDALRAFIGTCPRCPILVRNRSRIVFGCGNPDAHIMFVGEAPGRDEDEQGIPFVGRAGQLLTSIIEKGMGLRRDDVYIANILKCRPPNNREPQPDEVGQCTPFLNVQLEIVQPRVIVALGAYAAHFLAGVNTPISRLRGDFHHYRGIAVMPTFHPAYLLRNYTAEHRRLVWDDMKKVLAFLQSGATR